MREPEERFFCEWGRAWGPVASCEWQPGSHTRRQRQRRFGTVCERTRKRSARRQCHFQPGWHRLHSNLPRQQTVHFQVNKTRRPIHALPARCIPIGLRENPGLLMSGGTNLAEPEQGQDFPGR